MEYRERERERGRGRVGKKREKLGVWRNFEGASFQK